MVKVAGRVGYAGEKKKPTQYPALVQSVKALMKWVKLMWNLSER
jgi:hypothetical protein